MKTSISRSPRKYCCCVSQLWHYDVTQTPIVMPFWRIVIRTFLSWSQEFSRHRQVDYHSIIIKLESRRFHWLACEKRRACGGNVTVEKEGWYACIDKINLTMKFSSLACRLGVWTRVQYLHQILTDASLQWLSLHFKLLRIFNGNVYSFHKVWYNEAYVLCIFYILMVPFRTIHTTIAFHCCNERYDHEITFLPNIYTKFKHILAANVFQYVHV